MGDAFEGWAIVELMGHRRLAGFVTEQEKAENLHGASPRLLSDELFWEALGAFGGMTGMLRDLIKAAEDDPAPREAAMPP